MMTRLIAVAGALGLWALAESTFAQPVETGYSPLMLSAEQAGHDVDLMRRALETIHPGLHRYTSRADIDAAFDHLHAAATQGLSDLALWQEIAVMLARIHCDHTKAEMSLAMELYRELHATHLPLRFSIIEGRMIVVSNDGQPNAPPPGAELVSINDAPVPSVLSTLARAVSYDGSTNQAIPAKLASDSDLSGDDFNEYWPAWYGFPAQWTVQWKRRNDLHLSSATLAPITLKAWTTLRWPGSPYREEFYKSLHWRITGRTAYLSIDTYVNYRNPVDATMLLGAYFKSLKAAQVDHLILDLRQNGGGSEDVSVALGRYLLPERFIWSKPALLKDIRYGDLPNYMESWGNPKELFEPPEEHFRRTSDGWWERLPRNDNDDDEGVLPQDISPDRFGGRLTLITGPTNASGATRTVAQLREHARARLVGEDTSGSAEGPTAGHVFLLTLPNSGIKVRIPNAWNRTNVVNFQVGRGVTVDELVTPTLADFDEGRDRALEVARKAKSPGASSLGMLAGNWAGTLEYRDFGSDRRVTLPLTATAHAQKGQVRISFTIDDGPGKIVHSDERWSISADGKTLQAGDAKAQMRVVEFYSGGAPDDITLVAEGAGIENDSAVKARTIVTRRGDTLSIAKTTQLADGPFLLRDAYRMTLAK